MRFVVYLLVFYCVGSVVCDAPKCRRSYKGYEDPVACKKSGNCKIVVKYKMGCCAGWTYEGNQCVPKKCNHSCINGKCDPETMQCICDQGTERFNTTHCKPICKDDYYNDLTTLECKLKCPNPCINGKCKSIETCECFEGYKFKSQYECEPACDSCEDGICLSPGNCIQICEKECVHGECTAKNTCTCKANYTKDSEDTFKCNPLCDFGCTNGVCLEPNKCVCNNGYVLLNESYCVPKCESCEYGECISPNECRCGENSNFCENGECAGKCQCKENFERINGTCLLKQLVSCAECSGACDESACTCPSGIPCEAEKRTADISPTSILNCSQCNGSCIENVCACPNKTACQPTLELPSKQIINCTDCGGSCNEAVCACVNGTTCYEVVQSAGIASAPNLAGLQITWMLGAGLGVLLIIMVLVVIHRIWKKRKDFEQKQGNNAVSLGSVAYTTSGTLRHAPRLSLDDDPPPTDTLLPDTVLM